MTETANNRFVLAERPEGRAVRASDFRLEPAALPQPAEGQVLLRTLYFRSILTCAAG